MQDMDGPFVVIPLVYLGSLERLLRLALVPIAPKAILPGLRGLASGGLALPFLIFYEALWDACCGACDGPKRSKYEVEQSLLWHMQ